MPRIPLVNRPNVKGHQDNYVPQNGAPPLSWRTNNGLEHIGEAVAQGTAALGNTAQSIMNDHIRLQSAIQNTEDKTQLHNLELAETTLTQETEQYFRENTGEYRQFPEYLKKAEANMGLHRKEIFNKMSPAARQQGEFLVEKVRLSRKDFMRRVEVQAHVTSQLATMENQLEVCAKKNNGELAARIIADNARSDDGFPPLLTLEMADKYHAKFDESAEFYSFRDKISADGVMKTEESGEFKPVFEVLQEKNDDGSYKYATNITQEQRNSLINYSGSVTAERRKENDDAFLASIVAGKPQYSKNQLEKLHDSGQITNRQFINYSNWLDEQARKVTTEMNEKMNKKMNQQKKNTHDAEYAFLLQLSDEQFSSNPDELIRHKNRLLDDVQNKFKDPEQIYRLHKAVDEQARKVLSGNDEFSLPEGRIVQEFINSNYRSAAGEYKGLYCDPDGSEEMMGQEFQLGRFYEIQEMARHQLASGKTAQEVISNVKIEVGRLNDGAVSAILAGRPVTKTRVVKRVEGKTGIFRGKKVVFSNGKWKYDQ